MSSCSEHSHFEELCALACVGQISPSEFQELCDHLRECACCRESYEEFVELTHQQLPMGAAEHFRPSRAGILGRILGKNYKARFTVRARERGIEISGTQTAHGEFWTQVAAFLTPKLSYRPASFVLILTLLVLVGTSSYRLNEAETQSGVVSAELLKVSDQNSTLQQEVEAFSERKERADTDLVDARRNASVLTARLRELEEQVGRYQLALNEDKLVYQRLNSQLNASSAHAAEAESKLREARERLAALTQEMAEMRTSRAEDANSVAALQVEIAELSHRAKEQEEIMDKQRKLLSVDNDVRDLMAARNLHITDVFDVDGRGNKKRAFGRVFYTEGRSLVFYAFDLDAPKVASPKHIFQAWGQRVDASTSAVSLGIFYVDDPAQKRWILKFDNPDVLAQISAVFVTAEPHGGAAHPTGQKLMYAYLGHEPNHP